MYLREPVLQANWCAKGICGYMTLDQGPTTEANHAAAPTVQSAQKRVCCGYFT
jgi:hypothetical protein